MDRYSTGDLAQYRRSGEQTCRQAANAHEERERQQRRASESERERRDAYATRLQQDVNREQQRRDSESERERRAAEATRATQEASRASTTARSVVSAGESALSAYNQSRSAHTGARAVADPSGAGVTASLTGLARIFESNLQSRASPPAANRNSDIDRIYDDADSARRAINSATRTPGVINRIQGSAYQELRETHQRVFSDLDAALAATNEIRVTSSAASSSSSTVSSYTGGGAARLESAPRSEAVTIASLEALESGASSRNGATQRSIESRLNSQTLQPNTDNAQVVSSLDGLDSVIPNSPQAGQIGANSNTSVVVASLDAMADAISKARVCPPLARIGRTTPGSEGDRMSTPDNVVYLCQKGSWVMQ